MLNSPAFPIEPISDLVARAINGDEDAFSKLFERYKAYAWSVALRTTSDPNLAEEAVIAGFAAAFRSLSRIELPESFPAYLGSCIRNEIFGQVRKHPPQRYAEFPDDFTPGDSAYGQPIGHTPESVVVETADGEQAFAALQRLDDRQQQAIYLVDIEELSTAAAAKVLGVTSNALHQLLFRARRSLRLQFIAPALEENAPAACQECNDGLAAYVHGGGTSNRRSRIDRHLATCPSCRIRKESAAETSQLISHAGAVLPVGIGAAVAAKVGFTYSTASLASHIARNRSIKHLVGAHPVKTAVIVLSATALLAAGATYTARSSPSVPTSNSSTPQRVVGQPRTAPLTPPPSTTTVPSASIKSTTPTSIASGPGTSSLVASPAALAPPLLTSSMRANGADGYAATLSLGAPFSGTVSTTTKTPSVTFSSVGSLPSGLIFADNGGNVASFSGVPTAPGVYQSALTASTPSSSTTAIITLTVTEAPAFTSAQTVAATVGSSLTFPISATGFPGPAFLVSGPIPPGLTLSSGADGTLTIGGVPTTSGSWTLHVGASNSVGSATQSLTITVS